MAVLLIAVVMTVCVALLLIGELGTSRRLRASAKLGASSCFVAIGVMHWAPQDPVSSWLVAGLALSLAGDLLLLFDRAFGAGLLAFLLAHLAYIAAFGHALPPRSWQPFVALPLVAAGLVVGRWLWPRLGRRRLPVTLYIIVISVMLWGAVAVASAHAMPWIVAAGALLFYLSDITVARDRFVTAQLRNRMLGLPAYYLGQLLIALAIGARP